MAPRESAQEWAERMNTGDGSIGSLFRSRDYSVLNGQPVYSENGGDWTTLKGEVVQPRATRAPKATTQSAPGSKGIPELKSSVSQPSSKGAYMLNGRLVRDGINGIVHDAKTGQPINAGTGKNLSPTDTAGIINPNGKNTVYGTVSSDIPADQYPDGVTPPGQAPSSASAPTTPSPSTGRNDSPPDGTDAKGTTTGFKGYEIDLGIVNADSARRGGRGMANVNDFLSEQLPVSASEKDVATGRIASYDR